MDRTEVRAQPLLQPRLGGVRDHQIGPAGDDLVEDAHVVREYRHLGAPDPGAHETFVAARIDHQTDARAVDVPPGSRSGPVFAARDGRLAVRQVVRPARTRLPPPLGGHRDAARRQVETVGRQVLHQVGPARRHEFGAHLWGDRANASAISMSSPTNRPPGRAGEGQVVARRSDAQHAPARTVASTSSGAADADGIAGRPGPRGSGRSAWIPPSGGVRLGCAPPPVLAPAPRA